MADFYSFGLVGYPVEHSLSPRLHTSALQASELGGEYRLYPVEQASGLQDVLSEMRAGKIHGLNVTIPYKRGILPLLDGLTPAARAIGAVNTVTHRDRSLVGDNTDASGFLADLMRQSWLLDGSPGQHALILGAGGAARAVVYALAGAGWRVTIAARRPEQAVSLVEIIRSSIEPGLGNGGQDKLSAIELDRESISNSKLAVSLIVNTTPVGMYPLVEASPWPDDVDFPTRAALYDLVYNPAETILMREAQRTGLRVTNGIGMLVEQAALSFEIWTGLEAPRQVMHNSVLEYRAGTR